MTEEEMLKDLAAADAAGQPELAQRIADTIRAQQANQPGLARRALNWATTPFENTKFIGEQNRAIANRPRTGLPGLLELTRDSGDIKAGLHSLMSGAVPGHQADAMSDEESQRMGRFRKEHPVLGTALPMAGGLGQPAMLPASEAAYFPQAATEAAKPAAAQTLTSTGPMEGTLQAGMRRGAETLGNMPNPPWDLLRTILGGAVGGHVLPGIGGAKGIPMAVAMKAAQKAGPRLGASALRGSAGLMDAIPQQAGTGALQLLRAYLEEQQQNKSRRPELLEIQR